MIKLIRTLAPENGMKFEDVLSFETENYVGMYSHTDDSFILFARSDEYFNPVVLENCNTLDELDEAVYEECNEHITGVSESCSYRIVFEEWE